MAASDSPRPQSQTGTEASPDEMPLGLKQPLLPTKPLGVNQQFLVPLGARSLSVLDPSIFSSDLIQADFLDNPFEDSPFFPSPELSNEASPAANSDAPLPSDHTTAVPPSPHPSFLTPPSHPTTEAAVQAQRSAAETADNHPESISFQEFSEPIVDSENLQSSSTTEKVQLQRSTPLQESLEPTVNSENLQSNSTEEVQLQRSTPQSTPPNIIDRRDDSKPSNPNLSSKDAPDLQLFVNAEGSNPVDSTGSALHETQPELSQASPVERSMEENESTSDTQNSTAFIQSETTEFPTDSASVASETTGLLSDSAFDNQITESNKVQSHLIQASPVEQSVPEGNERSFNAALPTPFGQTSTPESVSNQSTSSAIPPAEGFISDTEAQNTEENTVQLKAESLSLDPHPEKSIEAQTPVSDMEALNLSQDIISNSEKSVSSLQQSQISEATQAPDAATIQPKLEVRVAGMTQEFAHEPPALGRNLSPTLDLQQQRAEQIPESLSRSPVEQMSESLAQGSSTPAIQASPDNPQPISTSESTQGKTALSSINHLQTLSPSEAAQSKSSSSASSLSEEAPVEAAGISVAEPPADESLVHKQPDLNSSIESSPDLTHKPAEIESANSSQTEGSQIQRQTTSTSGAKDVAARNAPKSVFGKFLTKANQFISRAVDFLAEADETALIQPHETTTRDQVQSAAEPTLNSSDRIPLGQAQQELSSVGTQPYGEQEPDRAAASPLVVQAQFESESLITQSDVEASAAPANIQASPDPQAASSIKVQAETEDIQAPPAKLPTVEPKFTTSASSQPSMIGSPEAPAKVEQIDANWGHQSTTENIQRSIQESEAQPKNLTGAVHSLIQPLENQSEADPDPTVVRRPETFETDIETTQNFLQESDPSGDLKPENKSEIQTPELQSSVQKLESETKIQRASAGISSATSGMYPENVQAPIQRVESEIREASEVETSSELIEPSVENAQPSIQRSETESGTQTKLEPETAAKEAGLTAIAADIQTVASEKLTQDVAVKPEINTTEVETNTQSIDIQAKNIELMVQPSETGPVLQPMSEVEAVPELNKIPTAKSQAINIQSSSEPLNQKSETGLETPADPEVGSNSEPVAVSKAHTQLPSQGLEVQPAIQPEPELEMAPGAVDFNQLESNIQREVTEVPLQELGNEFEGQAESPIEASSELTETRVEPTQLAIQKLANKTEVQMVTEAEGSSKPTKVNVAESEIRSTDIQPNAKVQSSIHQSEAESVFQTQLQPASTPELAEVNLTSTQPSIQLASELLTQGEPEVEATSESVTPITGTGTSATQAVEIQRSNQRDELPQQTPAGISPQAAGNELQEIQKPETKPGIQRELDSATASEAAKVETTDLTSETQELASEPTVRSKQAIDTNADQISAASIQLAVQRSEAELETQKEPEVATDTSLSGDPAKVDQPIPLESDRVHTEVHPTEIEPQTIAIPPSVQASKAEPSAQARPEVGSRYESGRPSTIELNAPVAIVQPAIQKLEAEPKIQAADVRSRPESTKESTTQPEVQELTPQTTIQRAELKSEFPAAPEEGIDPESIAVNPAIIQPSLQLTKSEPEVQRTSGVENTPESGISPTTVSELSIGIPTSPQAATITAEIQSDPEFKVVSEPIKAGTPGLESPSSTTQTAIQRSEIEPGFQEEAENEAVPELTAIQINDSQPTVQKSDYKPEPQAAAVEVNAEPIQLSPKKIEASVQQSEIEPEIPGDAGAVSGIAQAQKVEPEIQTIDTQSSVQRTEAESELQTNLEVGIRAESVANNVAETQSAPQEAETEPKIQKMPEFETDSSSIKIQSKSNQSPTYQQESKSEVQTATAEISSISELTEVGITQSETEPTNVQATVQKLISDSTVQRLPSEAEREPELDVGINSGLVESSSVDAPRSTQTSEQGVRSEVQKVSGTEIAPASAEVPAFKPEAQMTDTQSLIQKSEARPEPQAQSQIGVVPEANRTPATAPEIQAGEMQTSAQTLGSESAPPIEPKLESSYTLTQASAIGSEGQSTDLQSSIQRSQSEPEDQVAAARILPETIATQQQAIPSKPQEPATQPETQALEVEAIPEAANSRIPAPEIQGTEVPPSIQKSGETSEAFVANEAELNQTSRSTESSTTSGVASSGEGLTISPDTAIERSQTDAVSPTQSRAEPANQTSEPGTSWQIQRQLDNSNIERTDRPPLNSSQLGQASYLQPDTPDAEMAATPSRPATPTTKFSLTTSDVEVTVQRSPETDQRSPEPASEHIPPLPQVLQDLSVLQPLSRSQSLENANPSLIQTKGYTNDSAAASFSPVALDSSAAKSFYPGVVQPAKTEFSSRLPNSSISNSNSSVESADALPSTWSSLADLMDGPTKPIQRSPAQNMPISQSLTAPNRSISGQPNTMIQAQSVEPSPVSVMQQQPATTVIARKAETDAEKEESGAGDYLEMVAQAIYDRLRQRMRVEQERHGRDYSGRLPW